MLRPISVSVEKWDSHQREFQIKCYGENLFLYVTDVEITLKMRRNFSRIFVYPYENFFKFFWNFNPQTVECMHISFSSASCVGLIFAAVLEINVANASVPMSP